MTDPFSVAGSAVGVASLGISILQGLVKYCTTYKDKDQEVTALSARCEGLLSIFEILEPRLRQIQHDPAVVSVVETSMGSCQTTLSKLLNTLQKLQKPDTSTDTKEKICRRARHILYPLNHHAIENLNRTLSDLQANLHIAIDVLHLSTASRYGLNPNEPFAKVSWPSSGQTTDCIKKPFVATTTVQSIAEDPLVDASNSKNDLVSQSIIQDLSSAMRAEITQHNQRSEELILRKLDNFGFQLESLKASFACNANDSNFKKIDNGIKSLQLAAIGKPSLLRDLCHYNEGLQDSANSAQANASELLTSTTPDLPIKAENRPFRMGCCCRKRRTMVRTWNRWPQLSAFSYQESEHEQSCPLALSSRDSSIFGVRLARVGFFLSKAVQFSIKISYGAGGYCISQNLNLAGVVHRDSPAFKLLDELRPESPSSSLQKLKQLFRDQKASPLDVDEVGRTLLHCAVSRSGYYGPDLRLPLVEGLIGLGVPVNELNAEQITFLDSIISYGAPADFPIARRALEIGAEVCNPNDPSHDGFIQFLKLQELADIYHCGLLSRAVLDRSWTTVVKILSSDPNAINEQNDMGQTPLHLAADWSEAVQVLLETGADPNITDLSDYLPVTYACRVNNVAAVELFLKADCIFWRESVGLIHSGPIISILQDSVHLDWPSDTLTEVVIKNLLQRREILKSMVLAHSVDVPVMKVIDKDCFRIIEQLGKLGVYIPTSLKVPYPTTVFHTEWITLPALQQLEASGFVDVFEEDFRGLTPLAMRALDHEMAEDFIYWIIVKYLEAPPETECYWNETVAATSKDQSVQWSHLNLLMFCISRQCIFWMKFSSRSEVMFFQVLFQQRERSVFRQDASALRHQCFCPCNADQDECSTLSIGLREILSHRTRPKEILQFLKNASAHYGLWSMADDSKEEFKRLFIRLYCMELLEIPHFCCTVRRIGPNKYDKNGILYRRVDEDDVEPLLEEHEAAISELNILVDLFSARECSGSVGLGDVWLFLIDHCWNLRSADKAADDELAEIRSAGVVIKVVKKEVGHVNGANGLINWDCDFDWKGEPYKTREELRAMAQELEE